MALRVNHAGSENDFWCLDNECGVCPALNIDLSFSNTWSYAGTVSSDKSIGAASVSLSNTSLYLPAGQTFTLVANVLPVETTNKTLTWSSSNTDCNISLECSRTA